MKFIFAVAATMIAFSAQANDRKIGNVIAVERQITNIYDTCLSNVKTDITKEQTFFFCSFSFKKSALEMPVTEGGLIRFTDSKCHVEADAENGIFFLTFGKVKGTSDFATAKNCLALATQNKNSVNAIVYTIE